MSDPRAILVVRRDNIGDLVCTTPLVTALRRRFPAAWIGVYANSYNAPILAGHPDVDEVLAYRKAKHYGGAERFDILAERIGQILALRRRRLDWVVLATPADQSRQRRLARWLGARRVAGFVADGAVRRGLDYAVPLDATHRLHEVEAVFRLAGAFGIEGEPPAPSIAVDGAARQRVADALAGLPRAGPLVAVHISARKPSQRWPIERFAALVRALHERHAASFVLLWAPGPAAHPQHPGDDERARELVAAVRGLPVLAYPTHALSALAAALAACDRVVCSDGGAMHVAAALGKPIVCFFGRSDPARWRPWGVPCRVLQPPSLEVADVSVEEAAAAFDAVA